MMMFSEVVGKEHFVHKVFCLLMPFSKRKWPIQAHFSDNKVMWDLML